MEAARQALIAAPRRRKNADATRWPRSSPSTGLPRRAVYALWVETGASTPDQPGQP